MSNLGRGGRKTGRSVPVVFSSECADCDVLVHWMMKKQGRADTVWSPLDTEDSFVCEHWREHDGALMKAMRSRSGKGQEGPVTARRLSRS